MRGRKFGCFIFICVFQGVYKKRAHKMSNELCRNFFAFKTQKKSRKKVCLASNRATLAFTKKLLAFICCKCDSLSNKCFLLFFVKEKLHWIVFRATVQFNAIYKRFLIDSGKSKFHRNILQTNLHFYFDDKLCHRTELMDM